LFWLLMAACHLLFVSAQLIETMVKVQMMKSTV